MKIPAAFAILIFCNVLSLHGESAAIGENTSLPVTTAQSGNNVTNQTLPQNTTGNVGPAGPTPSNVVPKDNSHNDSKDNGSSTVGNSTTIVAENETTTIVTPHLADNNDTTTAAPTTPSTTVPTKPTTPTPSTVPTKPTTPPTPTTVPTKPTTPNTTTEAPKPEPTTQIPVVPTTPTPVAPTTPAPHRNRFDGPSFIGGIVLSLGLVAIGFIGWKYYKTTILTCFIRSPLRNIFNFNS